MDSSLLLFPLITAFLTVIECKTVNLKKKKRIKNQIKKKILRNLDDFKIIKIVVVLYLWPFSVHLPFKYTGICDVFYMYFLMT